MPEINYTHLKYLREKRYYEKVKPVFDKLKEENPAFSSYLAKDLADFYNLLSSAIRIDSHPNIELIKDAILKKYDVDIPIRVFLYESIMPKALCSNRTYFENGIEKNELIILVSQHFFNYLDFQEQISILSHELCHLLLGHIEIPAQQILHQTDLSSFRDFRINLLKWSLCAEISSDIFALYASDFNPKVFSTSIIKFASGVHALDSYDLIGILLNQYEDISTSVNAAELTPHPILPLRIKVIDEVCECSLVKKMGKKVDQSEMETLLKEYNSLIDNLVYDVNPELFEERHQKDETLHLKLGTAVILADHQITEEEISALKELTNTSIEPVPYLNQVRAKVENSTFDEVIDHLIQESIEFCDDNDYNDADIIALLRFMLYVSAIDNVELEELNTIYRFASHYEISREEIILLLNQAI